MSHIDRSEYEDNEFEDDFDDDLDDYESDA